MNEMPEISTILAEASTLPGECYTSREYFTTERKAIFHNSWQYVCRADQVALPGNFVTHDIAGEPVLVIRGKDGNLRAMANVCRHRAARVECRSEGHATRFRCRYHGWAYNIHGDLVGTPDFAGVQGFIKSEHPLPQYHVCEVGPFIFVHLGTAPETPQPLFAPLLTSLSSQNSQNLAFHSRKSWTVNCNWKIFVDNYQDGGYHIPTLHPDLATVVNMEGYHTKLYSHSSLQLSPLKQETEVRHGNAAHYWWVYPNFMVNLYTGVMDINLVLPLSVDRSLVIFDYYFSPDSSDAYIADSIRLADQVQDEDIEICEEVQRGLSTKHYSAGRFSVRREAGVHLLHQLVASAVRTAGGKQ